MSSTVKECIYKPVCRDAKSKISPKFLSVTKKCITRLIIDSVKEGLDAQSRLAGSLLPDILHKILYELSIIIQY
jgi:hypothetical protein